MRPPLLGALQLAFFRECGDRRSCGCCVRWLILRLIFVVRTHGRRHNERFRGRLSASANHCAGAQPWIASLVGVASASFGGTKSLPPLRPQEPKCRRLPGLGHVADTNDEWTGYTATGTAASVTATYFQRATKRTTPRYPHAGHCTPRDRLPPLVPGVISIVSDRGPSSKRCRQCPHSTTIPNHSSCNAMVSIRVCSIPDVLRFPGPRHHAPSLAAVRMRSAIRVTGPCAGRRPGLRRG